MWLRSLLLILTVYTSNTIILRIRGAVLRWGRVGYVPPQIHLLPQIQKLADHSDVISEVPKMLQKPNFPAGGAYSAPQTPC